MFTLVRGRFTSFSGAVVIDPMHLDATRITVDIDASSVDSAMELRDSRLRGEEFFDVDHHPQITFASHGATPLGAGRYAVPGNLTIRGITQPVRLSVDLLGRAPDMMGNPRLGFKATARIQRARWNMTWNAPVLGGGVALADDVDLDLDISLVPAGTSARLTAARTAASDQSGRD
jgi:polyisoprenoid-binding protein YceI